MYKTCPKCGHMRDPADLTPANQCPGCGIHFTKWLKQQFRDPTRALVQERDPAPSLRQRLDDTVLVPAEDGRMEWSGRAVVWVLLLWLGVQTLFTGYDEAVAGAQPAPLEFLHRIDLVFHEAGHVIFRLLGEFMTVLGGSLFQVLVPAVVTGAFLLRHHNNFGASIGLWWTGQNLCDVAIYMADARALQLTLLGGGTGADRPGFHDWRNIFSTMGWLESDRLVAGLTDALGILCIAAALAWGGVLLWRQHTRLR